MNGFPQNPPFALLAIRDKLAEKLNRIRRQDPSLLPYLPKTYEYLRVTRNPGEFNYLLTEMLHVEISDIKFYIGVARLLFYEVDKEHDGERGYDLCLSDDSEFGEDECEFVGQKLEKYGYEDPRNPAN